MFSSRSNCHTLTQLLFGNESILSLSSQQADILLAISQHIFSTSPSKRSVTSVFASSHNALSHSFHLCKSYETQLFAPLGWCFSLHSSFQYPLHCSSFHVCLYFIPTHNIYEFLLQPFHSQ
jgi:hypothetical protein